MSWNPFPRDLWLIIMSNFSRTFFTFVFSQWRCNSTFFLKQTSLFEVISKTDLSTNQGSSVNNPSPSICLQTLKVALNPYSFKADFLRNEWENCTIPECWISEQDGGTDKTFGLGDLCNFWITSCKTVTVNALFRSTWIFFQLRS